ncbi:MAG: hypothetical protein RIC55_22585 [Pirellulaceae bacterium]
MSALVGAIFVGGFCVGGAVAVQPSEQILPATTKAYVAVPDFDDFRAKWNETQLGKLAKDPVMKPFAEDLRAQIKFKLSQTGVRLGLTLEDLQGVHGGEVCLAVIQPEGDTAQHAMALLADVSGHTAEAATLMEKISAEMLRRGATRSTQMMRGVDVTHYTVPLKKADLPPLHIYQFLVDDQFVAIDHAGEAEAILARLAGDSTTATLSEAPRFQVSMRRCDEEANGLTPHFRWFIEPFGYAETIRATAGGKRRRGTDVMAVLRSQGFTAIQGLAGHVTFATGDHELVYRTFIYAPAVDGADPNGEKYDLAARMLQFPDRGLLRAQSWIPRHVASYTSFNWKMKEAFEYSKTLVDELAGEEVFEEVLQGIKLDPKGPQVDLRAELVAHLGQRATVLADNKLPVTPQSQRVMVAIELTNAPAVAQTVNKAMETDRNAEKREFADHIIWEMVEKEHTELALQIDGPPGLGPFDEGPKPKKDDRPVLPHSAVTVAHGHLIFATHINLIRDLLTAVEDRQTLSESGDYIAVNAALDRLGGGDDDSFRMFTRTDEAYRPSYELMRQGKMPESETLLGRLLNAILAPEEEDAKREQQIDGSKMPDFQVVRRYLGPAGLFVKTEADGWYAAGCMLSKDAE